MDGGLNPYPAAAAGRIFDKALVRGPGFPDMTISAAQYQKDGL